MREYSARFCLLLTESSSRMPGIIALLYYLLLPLIITIVIHTINKDSAGNDRNLNLVLTFEREVLLSSDYFFSLLFSFEIRFSAFHI